jgi:hypothetical protein
VRARSVIWFVAMAIALVSCGSGPSEEALARDRAPATTTTTEPPPEGVAIVRIVNGAFRPSNLHMDLEGEFIVQWVQEDAPDTEYVIEARNGEFMSEPLQPGDVFEVDFSGMEPGIYRYFAFQGNNRIPGSVDTRPDQ